MIFMAWVRARRFFRSLAWCPSKILIQVAWVLQHRSWLKLFWWNCWGWIEGPCFSWTLFLRGLLTWLELRQQESSAYWLCFCWSLHHCRSHQARPNLLILRLLMLHNEASHLLNLHRMTRDLAVSRSSLLAQCYSISLARWWTFKWYFKASFWAQYCCNLES